LLRYLVNQEVILDAACGTGWFGQIFNEYPAATVIGIDLKVPPREVKSKNFLVMSVEHLGFSSNSFDCIIAKDILEHLIFPLNAMKEFHRVLKNKGKIIITVPSSKAPFLWEDYTHVRPFTKKSLHQLFVDSKFEVICMKYLAASTSGAALLRIESIFDFLARLGLRRGNILAIGQKQ